MAEEAVVRIKIDESAGSGGSDAPSLTGPPAPPNFWQNRPPRGIGPSGGRGVGGDPSPEGDDFLVAEARARLAADRKITQRDENRLEAEANAALAGAKKAIAASLEAEAREERLLLTEANAALAGAKKAIAASLAADEQEERRLNSEANAALASAKKAIAANLEAEQRDEKLLLTEANAALASAKKAIAANLEAEQREERQLGLEAQAALAAARKRAAADLAAEERGERMLRVEAQAALNVARNREATEADAAKKGEDDKKKNISGLASLAFGRGGGAAADLLTSAASSPLGVAVASAALVAAFHGAVVAAGRFTRDMISADDNTARFVGSLGSSIPVVGAFTGALSGLMHELDGWVARLGDFSPRIAQADAMSEVVHTLNEIRRAQEASAGLSAYVRARTDLQQTVEDAKVRMMESVIPAVIGGMNILNKLMPVIELHFNWMQAIAEANWPLVGAYLKSIRDSMEDSREDKDFLSATAILRAGVLDPGAGAGIYSPLTGRRMGTRPGILSPDVY